MKSNEEKLAGSLKELEYKEALKEIDLFVQEQLEKEQEVYSRITSIEHKINKKKWKLLKEKLEKFIANQKCDRRIN